MSQSLNRVLYLTYDGLTDPLGQSQILPYIIGLSGKEYSFSIISFEKPERFEKAKKEIEQVCIQHNIHWLPLAYHKNPPVLSTLFDVWTLWKKVKQEFRKNPFQIIHCRSYITSLIGVQPKKKWQVKFIFDMRGFWADERVEGGLWNLANPLFKVIYNFFKKKEQQFLRSADHVISLTENAKREILSWNLNNASITVIPTCVDTDLFDPSKIKKEDQLAVREQLKIAEDDFVLLYLGSWGTWYLGNEMLDFFAALKEKKSNAKFLILSSDKIDLERYSFKADVIVTQAARQLVPLYISIANLSVCFIKPSFSKKASSATKIGEILAMNVPVVTNSGWGDVEEMTNAKCGLMLLTEKLIPDSVSNLVACDSRKYCLEWLSLETGIKRYKQVYEGILRQ